MSGEAIREKVSELRDLGVVRIRDAPEDKGCRKGGVCSLEPLSLVLRRGTPRLECEVRVAGKQGINDDRR